MHLILNTASTDYWWKVASPGGWVLQNVESFKADDSIFEIKLIKPFPAFLGLMTMKYSVVPKEIVSHYGSDFRSHPIGTGPFQLKLWEENVNWSYAKPFILWKDEEMHCLIWSCCHYLLPDKQSGFCNLYKEN
jgi:peptide/nickel transport system substrate-binding protein